MARRETLGNVARATNSAQAENGMVALMATRALAEVPKAGALIVEVVLEAVQVEASDATSSG